MKKLKLSMMHLILAIGLIAFLPSCMTTHTQVGTFRETQGKEYTYASGKQLWVFWGMVPVGRTSVNTPTDGNCEITTKMRFSDVLISGITGGLITSYSIKVKAKRPVEK